MKNFTVEKSINSLRRAFGRRLLLLLFLFSVGMSTIIVVFYQRQADQLNRTALSDKLHHLVPRVKEQQLVWDDDASHIFDVLEWSGLLNYKEPIRYAKLLAFFTAQSVNMGFEGVAILDNATGKIFFEFWNTAEKPDLAEAVSVPQSLWFDDQHITLYWKTEKTSHSLGHDFRLVFFKAWDSSILRRISFPDTTTYLSLGSRPLLSSAGNLALETTQPSAGAYSEFVLNGLALQEGSVRVADLPLKDNQILPLKLTVRAPLKNNISIPYVLATSVGITLLFGAMLFFIVGRWLKQIGIRLDKLSSATVQFKNEYANHISDETTNFLSQASDGKSDQISMVTEELSSLMKSAVERNAEQHAYLQTMELLQDAVIEFSPEGRLLRATDAWKSMTGVDDIASCGITNCVHPEDATELLEQLGGLMHGQKSQINIRFRLLRKNDPGKNFWVEGRFASVSQHDKVSSIRGVVRDITTTYHQERQLNHMALHDALTDLPNRVLLEDRMEMAISRAARAGQRVALGFIDLDHFKQVNDNFGHKIGDRMLNEVKIKFTEALRSTDTLSRWGGDEFVVLCPDLVSLEDAREVTQKLSLLTRDNITIDGTEFPFSFSAGFAVYPDDAENSEKLLAQADRAMFYAKAQGRNNIQFFNTIANKETGRHSFYIQSRLTQAIHGGQIQCWLQPLVSAQTLQVVGFEALARWNEPEQGWIPPSVFIPMAESMGLIDLLGKLVWQQALHALTNMPSHLKLSVNLSKRQLFSSSIVNQLSDDIQLVNIKPNRIMLEITEGIALSDVAYARDRIVELDARGFGISIDDFGVGYSSLSQLHEIPADELKLDMSFVKRIHGKTGLSMAKAIISIAKSLNLQCVAEGVEDAQTADLLKSLGVEVLQGYYFSKPMPIDECLAWLVSRLKERS